MMIDDEELRNLYELSSQERLQRLEMGLLHLQHHPDDEATLEELRRDAHSLKGDSRAVGVETVATLIQQVEIILRSIQISDIALTSQISDRLLQGLVAISYLVNEAVTGQPSGVDVPQVLSLLAEITMKSEIPQLATSSTESNTAKQIASVASTFIDDEELRQLYDLSSQEYCQKLKAGLLQLEQYPTDQATLEELRREAHSFKSDSHSVGVTTVETLIQPIEEILAAIQSKQIDFTLQVSNRLDQGLDAIGSLIREAVTGQPSDVDVAQVLNLLLEATKEPDELHIAFLQPKIDSPPLIPTFSNDAELHEVYQFSSRERLQKLETGLLYLERHPDDIATLEELLREAHSLKGDSRSLGVESVETLTHQIEEILGNCKRKQIVLTPEVSDRLYQGLDAISELIREVATGQPSGIDTTLILSRLLEIIPLSSPQVVVPTSSPELVSTSLEVSSPPVPTIWTATQDLQSSSPDVDETYHIDTIRVSTRDLDALMTQAEELIVTKTSITQVATEIEEIANLWKEWKVTKTLGRSRNPSSSKLNSYQDRLEELLDSLRLSTQESSTRINTIAEELREKIRTLRLLPLSAVFQLFPRVVRDLAKQQAKEVELIVEGGETTADKSILEEIKDSLMHMIRNAIDHGIESPNEREILGKAPVAKIWLRAYQTANNIVIEIADDGRGLDLDKIKQTAIKRGVYQAEELAVMSLSQIQNLIFAPGFSTRTFITEISGRGIGLDVVRTNIERLKGDIQIESIPGRGCTFQIQLSTTLTTINVVLLEVQGVLHALSIEFLETTLLVSQNQIYMTEDRSFITMNDQEIPVADLDELLNLSNSRAYNPAVDITTKKSRFQQCIVLKVGEERAGFFVNQLLETQEVVIKPQSRILKRVRNVVGATILSTGDVCMILNASDLIKSLQKQTIPVVSSKAKEPVRRKPVILLVEDSVPVRTQERRLLERAGYEVVIAVDGLDAYNKLKTCEFDAVLSDVEMPNLDGLSLTKRIRQLQEYKDLPIILVTTLDSDEDKKRAADAGANAYIIKGKFNQDVLLEILGRLV
jgi:two-component system chemotaxis sensor kinase CheA